MGPNESTGDLTEDEVVQNIAEHINTMGSAVQLLMKFVKDMQSTTIGTTRFLTMKYGDEFTDFINNKENLK